jgi:hypothetical protein
MWRVRLCDEFAGGWSGYRGRVYGDVPAALTERIPHLSVSEEPFQGRHGNIPARHEHRCNRALSRPEPLLDTVLNTQEVGIGGDVVVVGADLKLAYEAWW